MPYEAVREFERRIAEWSGAKYGVTVESGSGAIFLACLFSRVQEVSIPRFTYPSVPCSIIHAGGRVRFTDEPWQGIYELRPYEIWDGALRFRKGMYAGGLHCLSFHPKKLLPIGRGGMILTDDQDAAAWLKRARFDGRGEMPLCDDNFTILGWNMYMTAEQASRGLELFEATKSRSMDDLNVEDQGYPDLAKFEVYRQ